MKNNPANQSVTRPLGLTLCLGLIAAPLQAGAAGAREDLFQGTAQVVMPSTPLNGSAETLWLAFSDKNTSDIVQWLLGGAEACSDIPWKYRIDCYARIYEKAARTADGKPDYRDARSALLDASRKLKALVEQNRDPAEPGLRTNLGTLRAVSTAARRQVTETAAAILQETETRLLRASGSQTRQVHYQRIAQAVGSNKVLLRSSVSAEFPGRACARECGASLAAVAHPIPDPPV